MKTLISLDTMLKGLALLLAFIYLQGCLAVQSFPTAARAGDTVTLAIGSLEGANKNNLSVLNTRFDYNSLYIHSEYKKYGNIALKKTYLSNLYWS